MPFKEISPEMQELLDKLQDIRGKIAAIDASYSSFLHEEEDTLLALQNVCQHDITVGYDSYTDENGVKHPEFKCCSICEKVLQGG